MKTGNEDEWGTGQCRVGIGYCPAAMLANQRSCGKGPMVACRSTAIGSSARIHLETSRLEKEMEMIENQDRPSTLEWCLILALPFIGTLIAIIISFSMYHSNIGG